MFQKFKEIDTAFRYIRLFTFFIILLSVLLSSVAVFKSYQFAEQSREHIYILANGKALEAFAAERKDNIPVEARDHIRMFHHYFFSLEPDEQQINSNLAKALYLGDESVKRAYDNLKERAYYSSIVSGNISQELTVDSIHFDLNQYPFYFRCYGTQRIIRAGSITIRDMVTEGLLRNTSRTDHNPHGFLIEKWNTVQNKDIKIQNR
jgi:conjugative transposon TraK protein